MSLPEPKNLVYPAPYPVPDPYDFSPEAGFNRTFNQAIALSQLHNTNALAFYQKACEFWLYNYPLYVALKVTVPDRPVAPMSYNVVIQPDGSPLSMPTGTPVAEPCPDPTPDGPAVPVPADPVGPSFGSEAYPNEYRVLPGDVTPIGKAVTNSRGTFVRKQRQTLFGPYNYFEKQ